MVVLVDYNAFIVKNTFILSKHIFFIKVVLFRLKRCNYTIILCSSCMYAHHYGLKMYNPADAVAIRSSIFPIVDTASIFLADVACSGEESRLVECPRSTTAFCRFFHNQDAGVRCQGKYSFSGFLLHEVKKKFLNNYLSFVSVVIFHINNYNESTGGADASCMY